MPIQSAKILVYPTESLQKPSADVENSQSEEVAKLLATLKRAMKKHNGIGIAAPQIGQNVRVFLATDDKGAILPFINPKIVSRSTATVEMEEGCLSIPGVYGSVKRPKSITIETATTDGDRVTIDADGMLARVIQHEYDHVEGILFIERASSIDGGADMLAKMEKQKKQ